jgi:hypothetical protein
MARARFNVEKDKSLMILKDEVFISAEATEWREIPVM